MKSRILNLRNAILRWLFLPIDIFVQFFLLLLLLVFNFHNIRAFHILQGKSDVFILFSYVDQYLFILNIDCTPRLKLIFLQKRERHSKNDLCLLVLVALRYTCLVVVGLRYIFWHHVLLGWVWLLPPSSGMGCLWIFWTCRFCLLRLFIVWLFHLHFFLVVIYLWFHGGIFEIFANSLYLILVYNVSL